MPIYHPAEELAWKKADELVPEYPDLLPNKTINQLRTFLINRAKKKIIQPVDLTDWDVVGEEVDAEYLDWIE